MTSEAAPPSTMAGQESVLLPSRRLDYLPIGLFGSVMSLTGLSVAWRLASARFGLPDWPASTFAVLAVVAFVAVTLGYAVKCVGAPDAVRKEFRHPIAGNLFGLFFISLLLLPIVIAPVSLAAARGLWVVGAVGMTAFAWLVVTRWLGARQEIAHATPAWIVPVVGLLDIPLALPALDLSLHGVAIAALGVGLFFAIPLFTLILMRVVFEPPMPDPLAPTLLILVAPFAVGASTYRVAVGGIDDFARALFAVAAFLLIALLPRLRHIVACCPFRVSWWAVGFPIAATSIAALRVAESTPGVATDAIAIGLLGFATIVVAGLVVRTAAGIVKGELRVLSQ